MEKTVRTLKVELRGTPYDLRTDMSPEALAGIAAYVDGKMREFDPKGTQSQAKVSMLTSLTIAGELLEEREQNKRGRRDLVRRLERLEELLDGALTEG
jgi:cell division protein ZapA (FtsZ GTPase activity inhibitor)